MDEKKSKATRSSRRVGIGERKSADGAVSYRGEAFDKSTGKKLRGPWTTSLAEARSWRVDAMAQIAKGTLSGDRGRTLRVASDEFVRLMGEGIVLNRAGDEYKPGVVRAYEQSFRTYVLPTLGENTRLGDLRRADVQRAVDRWAAIPLSPSTVRNTVNALRALCRYSLRRGDLAVNPTADLELPRVKSRRDHVVGPADGLRLIAALSAEDRAVYATAMFGGLRLGELRALRWKDVDLDGGKIRVERSWDRIEGPVAPKSDAGRRTVPIAKPLRAVLAAYQRSCPWADNAEGLAFGQTFDRPFNDKALRARAIKRWKAAGLDPIGLHEARHTAASWYIGAGVNLKLVSTIMGHASIAITLDVYSHLLPGDETLAADQLDAFFTRTAAAG